MRKDSLHVVYIGVSGFPIGLAAISRQKLVSRGLINAGAEVTVLCARSVHNQGASVERAGVFEGVPYRYAVSPFRDQNFLVRNLKRKLDWLFELIELVKINQQKKVTHVIISNTNVFRYALWIRCIAYLMGFKMVLSLVEIYKGRRGQSFLTRVNNYLFNHFGLKFFDGYLPISHQLEKYFSPFNIPGFYYPIIVDIEKIKNIGIYHFEQPNFVFCGAAGYVNTIEFVLKAFDAVQSRHSRLTLVAGGSPEEIKVVREMIKNAKNAERVFHLFNLSDEELYSLYSESQALLLPLFDTVQDQARFPHKLGEYLASGTCVITTRVGDLQYYLHHEKSAYIVEPGDVHQFSEMMDRVVLDPDKAKNVGKMGLEVCKENFEFQKVGAECKRFLLEL